MPANEPLQQGPYPEPTDPPDGPNQMAAIVAWAAGRSVMRFASTLVRDAQIPAPVEGMECFTGSGPSATKWLFLNGQWRDVTVRPWEDWSPVLTGSSTNPNLGTTGVAMGRKQQTGTTMRAWGYLLFGGAGITAGSGNLSIAPPAAPHTSYTTAGVNKIGEAVLFDNSAGAEFIRVIRANGLLGQGAVIVTNTTPVPWAVNDSLRITFEYEVAT